MDSNLVLANAYHYCKLKKKIFSNHGNVECMPDMSGHKLVNISKNKSYAILSLGTRLKKM